MPSIGLLLTCFALLAAPQEGQEDPASASRATIRRVARMSPEQQQQWMRDLERRLAQAGRITLAPERAAADRARVAAALRQKIVSWSTLLDLVRELDQREKAAVARLVRQYASRTADVFGRDGEALAQRHDAWRRVWADWKSAGSRPEQQDRLIAWLDTAVRRSTPGTLGPLPPAPRFSVPVEPSPLVAAKKPAPDLRPLWPRGTLDSTIAPPDPNLRLRGPDPRSARVEKLRRSPGGSAAGELPALNSAAAPVSPRRAVSDGLAARQPSSSVPRQPTDISPLPLAGEGDQILSPLPLGEGQGVRAVDTGRPVITPPHPGPLPEGEGDNTLSPIALSRQVAGSSAAELRRDPERPARRVPDVLAMLPSARLALPSPEQPQVRSLLPPAEPIAKAAEPGVESSSRPTPEPAVEPVAEAVDEMSLASAAPAVRINIEELAARIAGHRLQLRAVEAELDEDRAWSATQLESLLGRLEILVLRHKDLALFRELTTAAERSRLEAIASPERAVGRLKARIAEAHARVADHGSTGPQGRAEQDYLDKLARRAAGLSG